MPEFHSPCRGSIRQNIRPQYAKQKLSGTFRILMIGDSTLYGGSYIDQRELYSRQLEQHLRNAAGGRRVEILRGFHTSRKPPSQW